MHHGAVEGLGNRFLLHLSRLTKQIALAGFSAALAVMCRAQMAGRIRRVERAGRKNERRSTGFIGRRVLSVRLTNFGIYLIEHLVLEAPNPVTPVLTNQSVGERE